MASLNASVERPWSVQSASSREPRIWSQRYEIVSRLGSGSYGTAYLVWDAQGSKRENLVMKQVYIGSMDAVETEKALGEAAILKKLHHPNIVALLDTFTEDSFVCMITEFCEGGDLAARINKQRESGSPFTDVAIFDWFTQLTMALRYLHDQRILHRDIKTNNIFLRREIVKLGDFGIARVLVNTVDEATTFAGTPYFMSPEALQSAGYNSKSDMWALGCVLYELCCLKRAFEGNSLMGLLWKICEGSQPTLPSNCHPFLREQVTALLQRNAVDRPSADAILGMPQIAAHIKTMQSRLNISQAKPRRSISAAPPEKPASAAPAAIDKSAPAPKAAVAPATPKATAHSLASLQPDVRSITPSQRLREKKMAAADARAQEVSKAAQMQAAENSKQKLTNRNRLHTQTTTVIGASSHSKTPQLAVERAAPEDLVSTSASFAVRSDLDKGPAAEVGTLLDLSASLTSALSESTKSFIPENPEDAERYYTEDFDDSDSLDSASDSDNEDMRELQARLADALRGTLSETSPRPDTSDSGFDSIAPPDAILSRADRMANLRKTGKNLLQEHFDEIYKYLSEARRSGVDEAIVARKVDALLPKGVSNDAVFVVDQLVYMEIFSH